MPWHRREAVLDPIEVLMLGLGRLRGQDAVRTAAVGDEVHARRQICQVLVEAVEGYGYRTSVVSCVIRDENPSGYSDFTLFSSSGAC